MHLYYHWYRCMPIYLYNYIIIILSGNNHAVNMFIPKSFTVNLALTLCNV